MKYKVNIADRFFLSFLFILIACFSLSIYFSNVNTKASILDERKKVMKQEATLIANEYYLPYLEGTITKEEFEKVIPKLSSFLQAQILISDEKGNMLAMSNTERFSDIPDTMFTVNANFDMTKSIAVVDSKYTTDGTEYLNIGIPIYDVDKQVGYIILRSDLSNTNSYRQVLFNNTYFFLFIIIIFAALVFSFVTRRIITPIKKLNTAAKEYAQGNFKYHCNVKSKDEIGELAETLEFMASELSKMDEYRRNFIANVSHDFRSPLTSIKGYIEAMLDGTIPPEKQEKYLNIVLHESKRLTKLTQSLLTLESFDHTGPDLHRSDFDLVETIQKVIETFEGTCEQKKIFIKKNYNIPCMMVNADKTRIQQVIYNLMDNAIKFSTENSSIDISLNEKNEKVFVSIKDHGAGIPADVQKKIWVRFFKSDTSRGKDKQGTGLGLAITKEVIDAHGEHIECISTEGVGSEFIFSLKKQSK
ncbi:MAG: HAMP domain-containing histidine kinase [Lachnospiraceae bacterium]|nr:HAMP domain-containing histidine kinase [Lachnospiraceae bacterium]